MPSFARLHTRRLIDARPRTICLVASAIALVASTMAVSLVLVARASAATELRAATAYAAAWAGSTDLTSLQLGDGRFSTTTPRRGWILTCQAPRGHAPEGAPGGDAPWIHGSTWNYFEKVQVRGENRWASTLKVQRTGDERAIEGNGVPSHVTGSFPIQQSDPAAAYDRNPNPIRGFSIAIKLTARPAPAAQASCVPQGAIGIMTSGATLFNALDEAGRDAPAREVQDGCSGHPQQQGLYHYHALPACVANGKPGLASGIIGWAFDGYPITGPRGPRGVTYTNAMLDECHGTTSTVKVDGSWRRIYHYVATMEFPYTIGCFRGTPRVVTGPGPTGGGPQQGPAGGPPMKQR